jgi:hypothetical protein
MATIAFGSTPTPGAARRRRPPWPRLGALAAVALGVALLHALVLLPWYSNWGATPAEVARAMPGDELAPDAAYVSTRAVTIDAPPEAVWPWLVQMGQGRGGLYSYELLENLAGSDLHNADRIHPEWQRLAVGDAIRPVPEGYLGLAESPKYTVVAIEPNRALVLAVFGTFLLDPVDGRTTRLIMRGRSPSAADAMEPFSFIMARRMLLGIRERAEGAPRPAALDHAEVLTWAVAFGAAAVAAARVVARRRWAGSFLLLVWRPPLWVGLALDAGLVVALLRTRRAESAGRPSAARRSPIRPRGVSGA